MSRKRKKAEQNFRVVDKRRWKKSGIAARVEVDPLELTDQRLNYDEFVQKKREELLAIDAKKKIPGQEELEDPDRSMGPRMPWETLVAKIQKFPRVKVKDGLTSVQGNSAVAVYVKKLPNEYTKADNLSEWECRLMNIPWAKDPFFRAHKYVSGFFKRDIPEWGTVETDSSLIAVREERGWRSVVMALIKAGACTYAEAVKEFGDPSNDQRSGRWKSQMAPYKAGKKGSLL